MKFLVLFFFFLFFKLSFSQVSGISQGGYFIYENTNHFTKLRHYIPSSSFNESMYSEQNTYPNLKLGYTVTGYTLKMGDLLNVNYLPLFYDFGIGLNYGKSSMNAFTFDQTESENSYNPDIEFDKLIPSNQVFFNFYQPGNQCSMNDFGLNLHFDFGSWVYLGAEIDAGVSTISFSDSRVQEQTVKSTGWYSNARLQCGLSIPILVPESDFAGLILKFYGVFMGWSARTYDLDWVSSDKTLNDFSRLQSNGSPVGLGFSLSLLFD